MNNELNARVAKAFGWTIIAEFDFIGFLPNGGAAVIPDFSGDPTTFFKYVVPEIGRYFCTYKYDDNFFYILSWDKNEGKKTEVSRARADEDEIAEAGCLAFCEMMEEKK